jgi:hypothetical protein
VQMLVEMNEKPGAQRSDGVVSVLVNEVTDGDVPTFFESGQ